MLDHVFLSVSDIERSIAFYTHALAPLGITDRVDYDGKDGPPGHPDLKGFGCKGRFFLWLRQGVADSRATHVGFIANSQAEVDAAYAAAMAAGATDNGKTKCSALLRSALLCRQRVRPRRLQPRICFQELAAPQAQVQIQAKPRKSA